jgi:hypothetical protein
MLEAMPVHESLRDVSRTIREKCSLLKDRDIDSCFYQESIEGIFGTMKEDMWF